MIGTDHIERRITAGCALLVKLRALGVRVAFVNSGTDFPPLIEGLAEAHASNLPVPMMFNVPHEHAALGMAHGWHLATGETPAVILHTNVGLANGATGAINAAVDRVPMILMSGRTPTTEEGRFGCRTVPIGWGQEMRDQTALVREACKWDYELRFPEQVESVLDRAFGIANSTPKGPVYISLPREVLCESYAFDPMGQERAIEPSIAGVRDVDIDRAAKILTSARRPLIFAQRGAGSGDGFEALKRMVERWAIPVCQYWATALALDNEHPMAIGQDPMPWIEEADAILVIDCLAPWAPDSHKPKPGASIIHLGPDPLFSRFPIRNFRSDLSIACETEEGLIKLEKAMLACIRDDQESLIENRREKITSRRRKIFPKREEGAFRLTKEEVGRALSRVTKDMNATILSELGCPFSSLSLKGKDAWRQEPYSGGLGWSLPCAMGLKMGAPERLVVATMGDGSYLFANPAACHQVMEALQIPILIIVLNNAAWGAVRRSVKELFPHGYAARSNEVPLTSLHPIPDFVKIAEASHIWARQVTEINGLEVTLEEAITVVCNHNKPALLDIMITE